MNIYASPTFDMACAQFDQVAALLDIPENDRARLKFPKRALTVSIPVRRDDGSRSSSGSRKKRSIHIDH